MKFVNFYLLWLNILFIIDSNFCTKLFSFKNKNKNKFFQNKFNIPKLTDLKLNYMSDITAKYMIENSLTKSEIEKDKLRYKIINQINLDNLNEKEREKLKKTNEIAYYGTMHQNNTHIIKSLTKGPPDGPIFSDLMGRYGNFDVYPKDQKPYYGVYSNFRKIDNNFKNNLIKIPIIIDDLDNKQNSFKQFPIKHNITNAYYYLKDPIPYYDPTYLDKILNESRNLKKAEYDKNNSAFNLTKVILEKKKIKMKIQNYGNADKEETNDIIRKFDYSPITTKENKKYKLTKFSRIYAEEKKHNIIEAEIF